MKINTTKLVVGVLAVAGVASLVGSISGTVAWFQYNTRAVAEFEGITAKCTEFLEVRTVKAPSAVTDTVLGVVAAEANLPANPANGDKYLANDGNLYTYSSSAWTNAAASGTYAVKDGGYVKFDTNKWIEDDAATYGDWKTRLTNEDILTAAKRYNSSQANTASDAMSLSPVTVPAADSVSGDTHSIGDEKDAALGTVYGSPICGYELYKSGTYHWSEAKSSSVAKFKLQFRVLDIDGKTVAADKDPAMIEQDLYLTDLTVANQAVDGKKDITSALRFHVSTSTGNALLAPGANNTDNTVQTTTHGKLDLGGVKDENDKLRDVPNNYSFTIPEASNRELDYGSDMIGQTAYNLNKKSDASATNGLYPMNDGEGNLSGGKSFGKTVENEANTEFADGDYLTMTFTVFLEGWQQLGTPASALWSSTDFIGAKFNIGMSFGVTAL